MELSEQNEQKLKQSSKSGIFNQIKKYGESDRQERDLQKNYDQKIESYGDAQPLIQKNNKWWKFSRRCLFRSMIFILIAVIGVTFLLTVLNKKENQSGLNPQISDQHQQNDIYDFVVLNSTSALCLDGSPGAYYISKNGDPNNVYLHFQAGGWCGQATYQGTLQSCYVRSKNFLGSSKYAQQVGDWKMQGILSQNEKNYFKDWKKVFLLYCDGSGHQGTRKDPIKYKDTFLYFRGHNLTVERLDDVDRKIELFSRAKRIVVSGQSAGGPASLQWINYIADRAKNAKVYGLVGSAIFYDSKNFLTNEYSFRKSFITLMNITNTQIDNPLTQCVNNFPNEKYKCMFIQYFYPFLKVPIFISQSLYDAFSIPYIIGIRCNTDHSHSIIENCPQDKDKFVKQYHQNVVNLLNEIGKDKRNGIWAIDCIGHAYFFFPKYYSENFQVPQNSGNTINNAIQNWIENKTSQNVFIDSVGWPNNTPCKDDGF